MHKEMRLTCALLILVIWTLPDTINAKIGFRQDDEAAVEGGEMNFTDDSDFILEDEGLDDLSKPKKEKDIPVVFGTRIRFTDSPYAVIVFPGNGEIKCTGTVVAAAFVLTAAHCFVYTPGSQKHAVVYYGRSEYQDDQYSSYTKLIPSLDVWIHPEYSVKKIGTRRHADIALVELMSSIVDDSDIQVQILTIGGAWPLDSSLHLLNMDCFLIGYGYDQSNLTVYHRDIVSAFHSLDDCSCGSFNTVCAKRAQPVFCSGHSGFPLICDMQLYGIASYNYFPAKCKLRYSFVVNAFCPNNMLELSLTFTCPFLIWISDIIEEGVITSQPESCRAQIIVNKSYFFYIFSSLIVTEFTLLQ